MDAHIAKTLEGYGYQVTIIDALDNACSLKMANRIKEILAS
jgi:serine protease inhibitor ecotin